ncbi:hypothetical protein Misp01_83800 [Microtetraspora sp. NBRC 13810]|uniref:hypothetical protein n=1 Tax=Microtetraspora sp. NBRC 13810 TaxID=3030990 RepID=UPI0024A4799A|nr:hypothetical protein [Microtetraspora sp. NBRC 13810]GLW13252.1 hypothetical protein Misp01_83800 [Microtetraspora sp. NBRC 13810]
MTVENLRDVLREHADLLPPPNPSRGEQVRDRVRRIRARRRTAVGAVGAAVVAAAVALTVPLLPATPQPETTTTVSGGTLPVLPGEFTSADGTGYRLVARTAIEKTADAKATLKVPYTGKPLDVGGMCVGPDDNPPRIEVEGSRLRAPVSFMNCDRELRLQPLDVPEGATEVTVTFNTVTSGWGCTQEEPGGPCVTQVPAHGSWVLGVYEWTPPARPVVPEPLRSIPRQIDEWRLTETRSGLWPQDTTATFEVGGQAGRVALDELCSGELATRLQFSFRVNGESGGASSSCGVWTSGGFPMAMNELHLTEPTTVTVELTMVGQSTNRPIRWSVGLFERS